MALITSTDPSQEQHLDLLHPIFKQLLQCKVPNFLRFIEDKQREYIDNKLPSLTPLTLLEFAESQIRLLQHSKQWNTKETIPDIMALQLELQTQRDQLLQQQRDHDILINCLVANVSQLNNRQTFPPPPSTLKRIVIYPATIPKTIPYMANNSP